MRFYLGPRFEPPTQLIECNEFAGHNWALRLGMTPMLQGMAQQALWAAQGRSVPDSGWSEIAPCVECLSNRTRAWTRR